MSGQYAHSTGALGLSHMGWPLHINYSTTVDDFNNAGYQTILSGINHERHPRADRYQVDMTRDWADWKLPRAVDNALHALRNRDASRPFYLNIGTQEPHACIWKDVGERIPAMPAQWPGWMPPGMPRTPSLELAFRRFAAATVLVDREFGRLMAGLQDLNLADNTLVIFTTDHGMSGPRGKGSLYGLGTEITLLMRLPNHASAGQTIDFPVSNISLRATLAQAAGITTMDPTQGASIWPQITSDCPTEEDVIYLERNFHGEKPWRTEEDYIDCLDPIRAVRSDRFLYIRNFDPSAKPAEPVAEVIAINDQHWQNWERSWQLSENLRQPEELYDLQADPLEQHNLATEPSYAPVLMEMRSRLQTWMTATGDYIPGPPPARPEAPGWGPHWPPQ